MAQFVNLLTVVCLAAFVNGAAIDRTTDSYQNVAFDSHIAENEIPHNEEFGDIEGLLPPKPDATDHYQAPDSGRIRDSSYVMDNVNKTITLKGGVSRNDDDAKLSEQDQQKIKDLAQIFDKLLGAANIQPVVIVTEDDQNDNYETSTEDATMVPTEAIGYGDYPSDQGRSDEEEDKVTSFFTAIWDVIKGSVEYASKMLTSLTSSSNSEKPSTEIAMTETPSSGSSIVALEEPTRHSQLPSHEFEKGGRDIDSLLYGHGIV